MASALEVHALEVQCSLPTATLQPYGSVYLIYDLAMRGRPVEVRGLANTVRERDKKFSDFGEGLRFLKGTGSGQALSPIS